MKKRGPYLKDTSFVNLMTRRIYNVLLVANPYDAFMLEDDGRIEEKIFSEYSGLGLSSPPRFTLVSDGESAELELSRSHFNLVIVMPGSDNNDVFDIAKSIKLRFSQTPMVVLTPFSHGINKRMENEDLSIFEYVFCWLGNTELLLSIIKLMEDKMNLEQDIKTAGVQMILLVEDSIRFYSSILPNLYRYVLEQMQAFATEGLNLQESKLRKRGRPKIVLARSYEEAEALYLKHPDHIMGVISDARYPRQGVEDPQAGLRLLAAIRAKDEFVPLVLQSSETENAEMARLCGATFIDKNSKTMDLELRKVVDNDFGFGDLVFINPQTNEELVRVHNLRDLQDNIFTIPANSLLHRITRNHISRWLCSRAMFSLAEFLKQISWRENKDLDSHREIIFNAIVQYRRMKNQGVVAVFLRERFDRYSNFARIGEGSLGGKGRGLAFIDQILKRHEEFDSFDNVDVVIPKTVVLCTDIFDEFMETNRLYDLALSNVDDDVILKRFIQAELPERLREDCLAFVNVVQAPIAIRSSSLLEDSHYQPFAGVYSTYMIPYLDDKQEMLGLLSKAIKGVYASVYYRDSKAYMTATRNVIDQEKMAVVLQEVVGQVHGDYFYPHISGVARSTNNYPLGEERSEEGIVNLALGLGKYIVDGGLTLRVSPYHPDKVLQTSETEMALRETQTQFLALNLNVNQETSNFQVDDGFNLKRLRVREAEKAGVLTALASTYDFEDMVIRDGIYEGGRKVITFAGVLKYDMFPLPEILKLALKYGQGEMRRPVEIEFAVNLDDDGQCGGTFYLLQIRPIVDADQEITEDLMAFQPEELILRSENSLGNGIVNTVQDIVYVKTDGYQQYTNPQIADEVERMNRKFLAEERNYVLVGPGRWGSSDPYLGIPVKWPHISAAKVIVEAGLTNYRVDPSQGTHFFQNLTSFGVGYFTINAYRNDGIYNQEYLDSLPAVEETQFLRHVHFDSPITIMMDGKKKTGVVLMPKD
ncbi:MAG: PEP/pyruvate-binding domain-containing protein [Bacteroidaceae bacterium]|nr:PEP/pyruvate-binding domain-containing protein [Bacteroidaceae bacterium]